VIRNSAIEPEALSFGRSKTKGCSRWRSRDLRSVISSIFAPAIVFAFVGLLIVCATVARAIQAGSAPFGLSASKEGVKVETNFIGASLLIGAIVLFGAGYIVLKDYDRQLESLRNQLEGLQQAMEHSKAIDLNAHLIFPESENSVIKDLKEIVIQMQRDGQVDSQIIPLKQALDANERVVPIRGLHPGDVIRVTARSETKGYHSRQINIPNAAIDMMPDKLDNP
jgi:hypothetical protein